MQSKSNVISRPSTVTYGEKMLDKQIFNCTQNLTSDHVTKYVFENTTACVESVLYQYQDRTVLCISTQCGCKIGCKFCGTGKKFIRDLFAWEIAYQVMYIVEEIGARNIGKRFQIMFMSMGEPFMNYESVRKPIKILHYEYPCAELLISTMGPRKISDSWVDFIDLSHKVNKIGLQFSMHSLQDEMRDQIIPFKSKMTVYEIIQFSLNWNSVTDRPVFWNFILDESNKDQLCDDILKMQQERKGIENKINLTFSVECPLSGDDYQPFDYDLFTDVQSKLPMFNLRMFNPEGQKELGAGCGQLWYVQRWMKDHKQVKR